MRKLLIPLALIAVATWLIVVWARKSETPSREERRPNVLLVTLDTTRADHTSAYGYARPTTPRLADLATDGLRFEAAYAPVATTLPSHASMFTGLFPRTHGTLKNGAAVDPNLPLLSETLARAGYHTAAFVSSFAVSSRFGLQRGFSLYDDDFRDGLCKGDVTHWEGYAVDGEFCRRGDLTRARAEKWLDEQGYLSPTSPSQPFFVWIHFFDPHNPYDPPPDHAQSFEPTSASSSELERDIARYDAEIRFADHEMGKLLDRLAEASQLDRTLVIVAGDHGEGLMDHGWMLHGLQIYEEAVRIPLVVRWPGKIPAGTTIVEPVQLVDLTPTVLELTGIAARTGHPEPDGISLASAMIGSATLDVGRPVLLQRRLYASSAERGVAVKGAKYALRVGDWKYIEARDEGTFELYDLTCDPKERNNVADELPERRAALEAQLRAQLSSTRPASSTMQPVSAEDTRRLEALGYVQ